MSTNLATARQRRRGHYGAWRLLCAVPATVASLAVLAIALGWLGGWEDLVLLGWLVVSVVTLCRPVERLAVRLMYGYRPPAGSDAAALARLTAAAQARCRVSADAVDWYIRRGGGINAFAAGGRSVAVGSDLLAAHAAGRLTDDQVVAILVHDLLTAPVAVMPEMAAA